MQYEDKIDDFLRKKYNVLILDIQGVGQNISPQSEGWGILKYLKQANPNLVVIMFTGAEWSITKYKDEASVADDFIGKDLEFLDLFLDGGFERSLIYAIPLSILSSAIVLPSVHGLEEDKKELEEKDLLCKLIDFFITESIVNYHSRSFRDKLEERFNQHLKGKESKGE